MVSLKPEERVGYIDFLNVFSCLGVIFLHHSNIFHTYSPTVAWVQALFIQVLFYWSVPIFLMLSGAMLLDYRKKYDTKTFFKYRYTRLLIPFLFWSALVLLKRCLSNAHFLNNYDFSSIANAILGYKGASEYYFLVWMLSFYFLYPIFSLMTTKKNTLFYIVILMFLLNSTLVPFARLVGLGNLSQFKFPLPENFIFVLLGYLLFTTDIKKKYRLWIYAGALWGGIYKFLWIYYLSGLGGRLDKGLTGYFVFPSVLLASGVFVYFKYSHFYKYFSSKLLKLLSSCSLGIYLIHIVLLPYERQILNVKESNFYWRIFCPFLTYIVCLICVLIIKKIPLLRWVVGDAPRTDNLKST